MLPGGTEKLRPASRVRSPYALVTLSTSTTLEPRRGPTGMVMLSRLETRLCSEA